MYYLHEKKIILYGAGCVGKLLSKVLKENHIEVYRFVDRRFNTIKCVDGIKVESLDWLARLENKEKYSVIITFKNVFQQTEIAKKINAFGYHNIIYKPLAVLYGTSNNDELKLISRVHEVLTDEDKIPQEAIPSFETITFMEYQDAGIIGQSEDAIVVNFPVEKIIMNNEPSPWGGKNIFGCYPAIDTYRAFQGNVSLNFKEHIEEYINKVAILGAQACDLVVDKTWQQNVIESRYMVYNEMKRRIALSPAFFQEHAGHISRTENGQYVLTSSGKNRISTLICERFQYIPVKMSLDDYDKFLNKRMVNQIIEYLELNNQTIFAPIEHPYFYNYPYKAPDYLYSWMEPIVRIMSRYVYCKQQNVEFNRYIVLDGLNDDGKTERFMRELGYQTKLLLPKSELSNLLDKLFYMDEEKEEQETIDGEKILLWDSRNDIALLKTVLYEDRPDIFYVQHWDESDEIENILYKEGIVYKRDLSTTYWENTFVKIQLYSSGVLGEELFDKVIL